MTKLLVAVFMALGISAAEPVSNPEENVCREPVIAIEMADPEPMSCKASGHKCEVADDCCSRMCLKKEKKCG